MRKPLLLLFALTAGWQSAHAGTRTSAKYTVSTDTADLGGLRTASSSYTNDGGVETVSGVSRVTSPADISREGYVGQLTEVVSLSVASAASSISQATTVQLSGTATLDDATTSALLGSDIAWAAVAYPFLSINALGQLAAATNVYASPVGTVTGLYLGTTGSTMITVNGPYANGGIPDAWLIQYFGPPPNPAAAPGFDADGTGQTNLFKYLAGLNPTDDSRFVLTIGKVTGQNGEKVVVFTPIYSGRTYTVQTSPTLTSPSWQTLTNSTSSDSGATRTVTDLSAGTAPRFYRVQVSIP